VTAVVNERTIRHALIIIAFAALTVGLGWRVEISERSGEDRLLRDVFGALSIGLHEQAGELFLISDKFETLESAAEVHALASRVQSIVTEIGQSDPDPLMNFRIGHVVEELNNVVSAFRDDNALLAQRLLQTELTPLTMGTQGFSQSRRMEMLQAGAHGSRSYLARLRPCSSRRAFGS
jgi:hypothetical protein